MNYVIFYVLKADEDTVLKASVKQGTADVKRAISKVERDLIEAGTVESKGELRIVDVRAGFDA